MDLAICIAVKNRSNLLVAQEDPNIMYRHLNGRLIQSPSTHTWTTDIKPDMSVQLRLLPNFLSSLVAVKKPEDKWTIIIIDYESTDVNIELLCETILQDKIPYFLHIQTGAKSFDRGGGLDVAAQIAKSRGHDTLFFCDSDMFCTSHAIFDKAAEVVAAGKYYYPICFSFTQADHKIGFWRDTGFGMVFMRLKDYFATNRWMHNRSWGWEDRALHDSLQKDRVERSQVDGWFHQWHPNDISFKNREYSEKRSVGQNSVYYLPEKKPVGTFNDQPGYAKLMTIPFSTNTTTS